MFTEIVKAEYVIECRICGARENLSYGDCNPESEKYHQLAENAKAAGYRKVETTIYEVTGELVSMEEYVVCQKCAKRVRNKEMLWDSSEDRASSRVGPVYYGLPRTAIEKITHEACEQGCYGPAETEALARLLQQEGTKWDLALISDVADLAGIKLPVLSGKDEDFHV